jgi:hypothetical protein
MGERRKPPKRRRSRPDPRIARAIEATPVPAGPIKDVHRIAISGWRCLFCGACTPAVTTPPRCCDQQFAIRVDVIYPKTRVPDYDAERPDAAGNVPLSPPDAPE